MQQPLLQTSTTTARGPCRSRALLLSAAVVLVLVALGVQVARLHGHHSLVNTEEAAAVQAGPAAAAAAGAMPVQPIKLLYPVWWFAPFFTGSGYSTEAISYISSLLQTAQWFRPEDLWLSHSGDHVHAHVETSLDQATRQLLRDQEYNNLAKGLNKSELDRPAIAICHSFPDCWQMPADNPSMVGVPGCPCPPPEMNDVIVYRVGRTMFETAGLPQHLVQHCNAMDEIWVPTEFNRDTFINAGVDASKLRVVPQGIDAADFDPSRHEPLSLAELAGAQLITGAQDVNNTAATKPFVFMSVFKWEARKGWDVLLEAYISEFKGHEHVELHIMTKPFANKDQDIGKHVLAWLAKRLGIQAAAVSSLPKVYLHTGYLDDALYRRLYVSADCVVLPTRGEGWGRPQMEAMSMGRPVITTNWSGPTAYINERVAYPLAFVNISAASNDMKSTDLDDKSFNEYFNGQQWAQPSVEHLKQLMRQVYTHPAQAAAKGRAARQHVLQHFTPNVLAAVVLKEIVRIQEHLGPDLKVPTAEERSARQQSTALCHTYPHLCRQGPAGLEEAARRAQSSFSHYRGRDGLAVMPGHLTVQELLARARQSTAASGINLGVR